VTAAIVVLAALLAAVNGANDVPNGVATLVGAGVTRYRTAIAWGTLATFAGSVVSITVAERLTTLFGGGIVDLEPTRIFALAVLAGVTSWVALATALRLPVSTTHAIVGALVGAGLVAKPTAVRWGSIATTVAVPLLASVAVAFTISALVNAGSRRRIDCVCIEPAPALGFLGAVPVRVTTGTTTECRVHRRGPNVPRGLHWVSSGTASFARGLNDTPKIVAIAAFALIPAGWSTTSLAFLIATAMATGSVVAGKRVAHRLAEDIVPMDHSQGMRANVTLALLVGFGANQGLPMSTTHVTTGTITGTSGGRLHRLNGSTLRDFALAWLVTLPCAALVAAVAFAAIE
jgi:PiT family inorganic phosphate transporter